MKDIITPAPAGIDPAPSSPDHGGARPSSCNTDSLASELKKLPAGCSGYDPYLINRSAASRKGWQAKRIVRAWDGNDAKKTAASEGNVREFLSCKCDRNGNGAPYRGLSIELM